MVFCYAETPVIIRILITLLKNAEEGMMRFLL